jgi:hypothetical protein
MTPFKWLIIAWTISISLLFSLALNKQRLVTETRTFCAYGRIFVEFEESGKVWGTLMLDFYGKPISCKEGLEPEIDNSI